MFGDMFAGWNDQGMVNRIKELNPSANAQFIATPTFGHDCWENVYGGDELYAWLKAQRRSAGPVAEAGGGATVAAAPMTPARVTAAAPAPEAAPVPIAKPAPRPAALIDAPAPRASAAGPVAPKPAPTATPATPAQTGQPVKPTVSGNSGEWVNTPW